ncbi:MAG: FMN-binding protein [Gemmatimonadota bacterium]
MSERPLPTLGAPSPPPEGAAAALPVDDSPPSWRLLGTLALAGMLAGLLLVVVFQATQPRILAHQAQVLREAVEEVLGGPERYETLFVLDGSLQADPAGADTARLDRVYLGYDAAGRPLGFAVEGGEPGFQDLVRLIFGYDPAAQRVLGMTVLESKETPGLGDKIEKDSLFVREFAGVLAPLAGVKRGAGSGDAHEVDMITGATISSRAVIGIINHRLDALAPLLEQYWNGAVVTAEAHP